MPAQWPTAGLESACWNPILPNPFPSIIFRRLVSSLHATLRPDHGVKHSATILVSLQSHLSSIPSPLVQSCVRSPAIFSSPILAPCSNAKHRQEGTHARFRSLAPSSIYLSSNFMGNRHRGPNAISLIPRDPLAADDPTVTMHLNTKPYSQSTQRALPTSSPPPIPSHPIRLTRRLPHPRQASAHTRS